ncbi:MAG TPA: CHASE4 domain-containing protein, partial [Opitutus sp.]|nr:CHASE4 domain-containing protein [Opitutus sp.]
MSLKARFIAVLGLLLALFLGSMLWLQTLSKAAIGDVLESTRVDREQLLDRVLTLIGASLQTFAVDYSLWDDMIAFSRKPEKAWAAVNLDASLPTFNAVGAWVFNAEG